MKSRSNCRYVHICGYRYKIKIGLDTIYLFPILIENLRWEGCEKFSLHIARSSMLGLCDVVANASITSGFIKVAYVRAMLIYKAKTLQGTESLESMYSKEKA